MTPEKLAKSGSEHGHQTAFFAYAAVAQLHGFGVADLWANGHKIEHAKKLAETHDDYKPLPMLKWMHAIANGGSRGDTDLSRKIEGGKMKAEGVKKGVSDICLPYNCGGNCGLYIEMKVGKNKPSPEQVEFGEFVKSQCYQFHVCYSWQEAVVVLKQYLKQFCRNN